MSEQNSEDLRMVSHVKNENAASRYREKIIHAGFKLNLEQTRKAREKYGEDITAINARAKELFLQDLEDKRTLKNS